MNTAGRVALPVLGGAWSLAALAVMGLGDLAAGLTGAGEVASMQASSDPGALAKELRWLRQSGEPDLALDLVSRAPPGARADLRVRGEHALALLDKGLPEHAARALGGDFDPCSPLPVPVVVARARLQLLSGQRDSARKAMAAVLAQLPDQQDMRVLELQFLIDDGHYDQADRALRGLRPALHGEKHDDLLVSLLLAQAMEMMASDELLDRAVAALERAHDLRPDRPVVCALLVRALARWHRTDRAAELAEEALLAATGQARVELLYALGFVRRQQQRDDLATELFQQALELDAQHAPSRVGLARSHFEQGHVALARRLADDCLLADPGGLDALLLLAEIACEERDWDRSGAALEQVLERKPRHLRALWQLSRVRARQGRPAEVDQLVARHAERSRQLAGSSDDID